MRGHNNLPVELLKGALAGALATKVMERISLFLYEHEDPAVRRREDEVRQDKPPYLVAADKTAKLIGRPLTEEQKQTLAMAYHWGLGLSAGALYAVLRRRYASLNRTRGLGFGLAFFLLIDEMLNAALRLTPPPKAFPWQAHARGLVAHLAYAVAANTALDALDRAA